MRRVLITVAFAVLLAGSAIADPGLALALAPALMLLGLLVHGVRPGERLIQRLTERSAPTRCAASLPCPRLADVIRPVGRQLSCALAMRPPPFALTF